MEHVDERKTLVEFNRILKFDGLLVINVPAFKFLWSKWDEVLHHKRRYIKARLVNILEMNGYKVEKTSYYFSFLVGSAFFVRFVKSILFSNYYPSDFRLSSTVINKIMVNVCDLERFFVLNTSVPFGTSLVCVARKI